MSLNRARKNRFSLGIEPLESRVLLTAEPLMVNSIADVVDPDDNVLTFREAVNQAVSGDKIVFDQTVFSKTNNQILLESTILIDKALTIDGALSDGGRVTLWANASEEKSFRVININKVQNLETLGSDFFTNVTLAGLNIEGGYLKNGNGAGINVSGFSIKLNIENCSIANNYTESGVGGGLSYSDAKVSGSVSAVKVSFLNNSASRGSAFYVNDPLSSVAATLSSCVFAGNNSFSGPIVDIVCGAASSITDCTIAGNVIDVDTASFLNFSYPSNVQATHIIKNVVVSDNKCVNSESKPESLTIGEGISVEYSLFDSCSQLAENPDFNKLVGTNYFNPEMKTFAAELWESENGEYLFKKWTEAEWLDNLQLAGNSIAVNTGSSSSNTDAQGNNRAQGGGWTSENELLLCDRGALEYSGTAPTIDVQIQELFICELKLAEGTEIGTISISDQDNLDKLDINWPTSEDFSYVQSENDNHTWTIKAKKDLDVQNEPYSCAVSAVDTYGKESRETISVIVEQKMQFDLNLEASITVREKKASESDSKTVRTELPENSVITEWSQYYVEVWAKYTSQNLGNSGNCRVSFTCTVISEANSSGTNLFIPESYQAGGIFTEFQVGGMVQGDNGALTITCSGTISNSLLNQQILLGKILYSSINPKGEITNQGGAYTHETLTTTLSEFDLRAAEGDGSLQNVSRSHINNGQSSTSKAVATRCVTFDSDDSGTVNMTDFINFAQHFNHTSEDESWLTSGILYDYNGDNKVNMDDFIAFAQNFNASGERHSVISFPTSIPSDPASASAAASISAVFSASEFASESDIESEMAQELFFEPKSNPEPISALQADESPILVSDDSERSLDSATLLINDRNQNLRIANRILSESDNNISDFTNDIAEELLNSLLSPSAVQIKSKSLYPTESLYNLELTDTDSFNDNNDNSAQNGDLDKIPENFPQNGQIRLAFPGRI